MTGPDRPADTLVTAPRGLVTDSRMVLMAGVAGACLLGAAAGAWVRPEADDLKAREAVGTLARNAAPMAPAPQMQIVMDAEMLPARPPMEVLPAWIPGPETPEPSFTQPPATAPFVAPPLEEAPSFRLVRDEEPAPPPKAEPPKPRKVEKAKPAKVQVAKAEEKPAKPKKAEKPVLAKAEKTKAEKEAKAKTKLANAEKAKKAKDTKLAKAEAAKKAKESKLAKAQAAKKKTEKIVLAKAEPKPPEKAKAKPMAVLLAEIEKLKAKPAEAPPVKLAEAKPPPPPKAEAPAKIAKATAKAPVPKAAPRPAQQARRAENPWADQDRRLARAYQRAAEAGVPEWRLERQQARWRQARDAAEREAPWAVRRVYDARIAELDDLAGEAAMEWN